MASEIKANKISPATGTDLTIGDSGDTLSITGTVSTTGNSTNTGNLDVTGDLTVDTNTLYVDSTSNKVGVGTTSPTGKLSVVSGTNSGITVNDGTVNTILYNTSSLNGSLGTTTNHPMAFYTNNAERMRIDSSGNVLFNTTGIPNGTSIYGSAFEATSRDRAELNMALSTTESGIFMIKFFNPNGQIGHISTSGTSGISYNTSSDYRLKENVSYDFDATTRLKQSKPARFNFIADADTTVDGFLAHEVSSIVPEAISGEKDAMHTEEYEITPAVFNDEGVQTTAAVMGTREVPKYQGIDQSKLVPLLTSALQEAVAKIESLETRVSALEAN